MDKVCNARLSKIMDNRAKKNDSKGTEQFCVCAKLLAGEQRKKSSVISATVLLALTLAEHTDSLSKVSPLQVIFAPLICVDHQYDPLN